MLHLYDGASINAAPTLGLDPSLRELLLRLIASLHTRYGDLTDATEILILQPGDTEADVVNSVGFSPLIEPFDGIRYGQPGFHPGGWDGLTFEDGHWLMTVTFGSDHAVLLIIPDREEIPSELRRMCREFGSVGPVIPRA